MNLKDPLIFGPGLWFSIHILAMNSNTYESKVLFWKILNIYIENMKCLNCYSHAKKYISSNKFDISEKKIMNGKDISAFYYTWKFHNDVNRRLGKVTLSFKNAYNIYLNNKPCINCGNEIKYNHLL